MTETNLDAAQALTDAATPGPWKVHGHRGVFANVVSEHRVDKDGWLQRVVSDAQLADAEFIAQARTLVPELIERVRELESRG